MKYTKINADKPYRFVGALWKRNDKLPEYVQFKGNFQLTPNSYTEDEKKTLIKAISAGKKIEVSIVTYKGKAEGEKAPAMSITFGGIESVE